MTAACVRTQRRKCLVLLFGSASLIMILVLLSSHPSEQAVQAFGINYIDSDVSDVSSQRDKTEMNQDDQDSYWREDNYDERKDEKDKKEKDRDIKETHEDTEVIVDTNVDTDSDSEEDDGYYENKPFEMSDFENISSITVPSLRFEEHSTELKNTRHLTNKVENTASAIKNKGSARKKFLKSIRNEYRNVTLKTNTGIPVVEDMVFWSTEVEAVIPRGISDDYITRFVTRTRNNKVITMAKPDWKHCGRVKNQYLTMGDGRQMCARNRPRETYIQGEVLSFYLSRLLGMNNVPIVVLSKVNTTTGAWKGQNITKAEWQEGDVVGLIQWIDNLHDDKSNIRLPPILLQAYESSTAITYRTSQLQALTLPQLAELAQWSDLILFDFLTGNYDRIASMQDGADHEKRPHIMHENIRNLRKSTKTNSLWMFDNESGLLDAYELLYRPAVRRFEKFHEIMLRTICIFRQSTIRNLKTLARNGMETYLVQYAENHEPLLRTLKSTLKHKQFHDHFRDRVERVLGWFGSCQG